MNAIKATMNRAKQTIEEKVGDAKKTELDPDLQRAVNRMDDIKNGSQKIVANIEAFLQPDPAKRVMGVAESFFSQEGKNKAEIVSEEMSNLGTRLGTDDTYGQAMIKAAEAFNKLGQAERERLKSETEQYLKVVKGYLNTEIKAIDTEKKDLENKRLDMDALKPKAEKGNEQIDEEYKKTLELYQVQVARLREVVKEADDKLPELKAALKAFVAIELEYLSKCQQIWKDFDKQLG